MHRLELLKTLGDNTRYAIYLEIARSPAPLSTAEIAETLALHANTVRPHLERMRDAGLLDVEIDSRGAVGRPVHRYSLATDAPSLGLEPPVFPMLAGMLASVAALSVPDPDDVSAVGRDEGRALAGQTARGMRVSSPRCVDSIVGRLHDLGFDPVTDDGSAGGAVQPAGASVRDSVIGFAHCPYRELAEVYPELVCGLHRGMVEGMADAFGEVLGDPAEVIAFHTLADRDPCQVTLRSRYAHLSEVQEDSS